MGNSSAAADTPPAATPPGATPPGGSDAVRASASARVPDLYHVATHGPVSFQHIAQARRIRQLRPELKAESRLLERMLEERYLADEQDGIRSEFWCQKAYGGCALTTKGRLHSVLNTFVAELVVLEGSIRQLARDVDRVFQDPRTESQRTEALETLYSVMARVMATADVFGDTEATPAARDEALGAVRAEWYLARQRTAVLVQRQARFEYLGGVLVGLAVALILFSGLGALAAVYWPDQIAAPAFLAATLAGSVGALVSVVQRMASGDLVLDYTAAKSQKRLIGAARPLVGGIFAAVVHFALLGGLLTMQGTVSNAQDTPATFAFFALTGFAAGFSERFATDILERAGASLATQDKKVADTAASASPPAPPAGEAASVPVPDVGATNGQAAPPQTQPTQPAAPPSPPPPPTEQAPPTAPTRKAADRAAPRSDRSSG